MITKHDDLLGTLIHNVAHLLRHDIDRRLLPYNLTRAKWLALGVIEHMGPLTQSELATELELGAASVGRLVDRLVDRGFVIRDKAPDDRRSHFLSLTPSAIDLLKELEGTSTALRKETLHTLSETEVASLNSGLVKLKKNLKAGALAGGAIMLMSAQKMTTISQYMGDFGTIV